MSRPGGTSENPRNNRGVVGPVLEDGSLALMQLGKLMRAVAMIAGVQNHVVRALDRADAVYLNKSQALDGLKQPRLCEPWLE